MICEKILKKKRPGHWRLGAISSKYAQPAETSLQEISIWNLYKLNKQCETFSNTI